MEIAVIGSTGLVGGACVHHLLREVPPKQIHCLARRHVETWPEALDQRVDREFRLPHLLEGLDSLDLALCTLGTTRKQAGSEAAFDFVDRHLPLAFARAVKAKGVKSFHVISSIGASKLSNNFYLRTKGIMEAQLMELGFPHLHIYRPSLLLGQRVTKRPLEAWAGQILGSLGAIFPHWLHNYRPVPAERVAAFVCYQALKKDQEEGVFIWENKVFHRAWHEAEPLRMSPY